VHCALSVIMQSTEYSIIGQTETAGQWHELARCPFMSSASIILIALREAFPRASFKIQLRKPAKENPTDEQQVIHRTVRHAA